MTRVLVVLLVVSCCWDTLSLSPPCSNSTALCYVTLEYPDHFAIHNNTLLVGLRNEIKELTLDLKVLRQVDSFNEEMNVSCHNDDRNEVTDCHNYHRSIIFPSGDQEIVGNNITAPANQTFIACGTNYLRPICQYRLISDLSLVKEQRSTGFCPEHADVGTAFVEFNTTLWVGTIVKNFGTNGVLSQSQQPFNGQIIHSTVLDSNYWLKTSSFVDMYEEGEYVYAFFREVTVELNPNAVRSRVARICKTDEGQHSIHQKTYQTYIKSSIRCAVQGAESAEERYQNVPFYFDNLHDTTLLESGSYRQSSTVRPMQLYGVFQNSGNGPTGSVVCVYTLDHMSNDVTRVFSGDYLTRVTSTSTWQRANNDNPFSCERGRSVDEAENDIIMYNDVSQANPPSYPLYMKDGQRFHKIVVGQVTGLDGIVYEVMFIAAEDEEGNYFITKVSYVEGRTGQRSVEHDVLMLDQSDHRINHMHYHKQDNGEDILYISMPNRLYRMNPSYCGGHQSCSSCVASMDPYCVYDTVREACVGINSANQNTALQNVTGGTANCPIPVTTAVTSPTPTSSLINSNISSSSSSSSPSIIVPLPTSASLQDSSSDNQGMWGWLGIGGGVGICVGIVIGIFFMFAWQRRLGFLRYCSEDSTDGPCVELCKGACGSDEDYKKSFANVENGMTNGDHYSYAKGITDYPKANGAVPNGKSEHFNSAKGNNYTSHDLKHHSKCDQSNASYGVKCNQSLHERRTSQPAKILTMQQMEGSPHRVRSHSVVHPKGHATAVVPTFKSGPAVSNKDMARYGSNYALDADTSKPTLTPTHKYNVCFDPPTDTVDLECSSKWPSTDC